MLVGEFGETVVIDWGMAKDLADSSGSPDTATGPYRTTAVLGQTVAGTVIGTPAYMPAEQAEGEPVDERADVYALGAMLYHLLAGAPPYVGKTDIILDAVIAGPPEPLETRTPGVPPDLVAIVAKAMAHAAANRYPTAKQLADDLKKFQTGQLVGLIAIRPGSCCGDGSTGNACRSLSLSWRPYCSACSALSACDGSSTSKPERSKAVATPRT